MILSCEICQSPIATFDTENMEHPIDESMFYGLMPERGMINPFLGQGLWSNFLCPLCGRSPFLIPDTGQVHPDHLLVKVENVTESSAGSKRYVCEACNFETTKAVALSGHLRSAAHKEKMNG